MKVRLLNNRNVDMDIKPSNYPVKSENSCRSKIQYAVGQYLIKRFPFDPILEDVPTPEGFYFDFFLPKRKLALEIQGEQHSKFVQFFHKTQAGFNQSKIRDNNKREFCRINDISLVEITSVEELEQLWK